jgi:hypothetical protein
MKSEILGSFWYKQHNIMENRNVIIIKTQVLTFPRLCYILLLEYTYCNIDVGIMNEVHITNAEILKAIGHPVRYCIIEGSLAGEQNVAMMVICT